MSENTTEVETPAQEGDDQQPEAKPEAAKKPETDWRAEARKWEQRAKEYKPKADKLAEIEEASKTEAQRQADRLAALEAENQAIKAESLRFRIASQYGIGSDDAELFLTGSDEDSLTRQAERLAAREAERKAAAAADEAEQRATGNLVPREGHGLDQHTDSDTAALGILGFGR